LAVAAGVTLGLHTPQAHAQSFADCISASGSCASAGGGVVTIAAAASTVVVTDSLVTASNPILVGYDSSQGTALSVTCNTTAQLPYVTTRVVGVSFTIATASTFTTNPGCIAFKIFP
jgi:hypothetical protein